MKLDIDMKYFKDIQGHQNKNTLQEDALIVIKNNLTDDLESSLNYVAHSLVNGIEQPLIIVPHTQSNKIIIESLPNDKLSLGDLVFYNNQYWLVTEVTGVNLIQTEAVAVCCNYCLRWQNKDGNIHNQWAVIEYSNTINTQTNNKDINYLVQTSKIYLSYNDASKNLFIDKRLALGKIINQDEQEILNVYQIIGAKHICHNNDVAHSLLLLDIENGQYNSSTDNIQEQICDYIPFDDSATNSSVISGFEEIRVGSSHKYTYPTTNLSEEHIWDLSPIIDNVRLVQDNDICYIHIGEDESLHGIELRLSCSIQNSQLEPVYKIIKVV